MELGAFDLVVVGAGFTGATIAENASRLLGARVLILEQREHIGGNAYSSEDPSTGIEVHPYGTHIFHTNSDDVWEYINRFTNFTDYRHRVLTISDGMVYPMPICLGTISAFLGRAVTPGEAKSFVEEEVLKEGIEDPSNLEEVAIQSIGRSLYEAFIKGYTWKQWQTDPRELPANIIRRLPVRYTFEDRYFTAKYEGMPTDGYSAIFQRMLSSPLITVMTGVDYFEFRDRLRDDTPLVYTGPIDRYFDHRLGTLGWRTVEFEWEVLPIADFQGTPVMNYADVDVPYTRIHEFRHLHPERRYTTDATVISREFARFAHEDDQPYYPIRQDRDKALYDQYRELADAEERTIFAGRLGTYRYLDMDQAIGAALKIYETEVVQEITTVRHG